MKYSEGSFTILTSHYTIKNHHQKTVHFEPESPVQFAPESPVQFKPELGVQFAPEYPVNQFLQGKFPFLLESIYIFSK